MIEPMKIASMVADLKEGVLRMGMHEDNSTELFDIDGANDLMFEGGNMLEALAAAQQVEVVKLLTFGTGALVIDTGSYGGKPAVFVSPAKYPGEVGASAKRENHPLDSLVDGDTVMTFPTDAQAKIVADALCNALTPAPEPQPAPSDKIAEALRFYADRGNYKGQIRGSGPDNPVWIAPPAVSADMGIIARAALRALAGKEQP